MVGFTILRCGLVFSMISRSYTASLTCWSSHLLAFRGADPFFLANLESFVTAPVRDLHLTKSFRFGKNNGAIANLILFAKSHSPQVQCFLPYRLLAGAYDPGVVSSKSLEELGLKSGTIVCRHDASLVEVGLGLLESSRNGQIAILGPPNNESSGKAKLKKVCKEIELFYNVFMGTWSRIEGIGFEGLVNLEWGDVVNMVNEEAHVPNCLFQFSLEVFTDFIWPSRAGLECVCNACCIGKQVRRENHYDSG